MSRAVYTKLAALGWLSFPLARSAPFLSASSTLNTLNESSTCAPFSGTFSINNMQLYPENADWDPVHCKLYLSGLFNASVLVYDPYASTYDVMTFDGITHNDDYHASGIDFDPFTGHISVLVNAPAPFVTSGVNLTSGPDKLIRFDPATNKTVFTADLSAFEAEIGQKVGITSGGPQDMATDAQGNSYVPLTYGTASIAKVSPSGEVSIYYAGNETGSAASLNQVYGGLVYHAASQKLIISDGARGGFITFDTTSATPKPINIPTKGWTSNYTSILCDGVLNPTRYAHNVVLCSEDILNAVTVFATTDNWTTAQYLGRVDNSGAASAGGLPVATVQIAGSLFAVEEFFADTGAFDVKGDRAVFPIVDYTAEIDGIVKKAGFSVIN